MINDEVTKEFLVESHEGLDQLDREFVALEQDPSARDRIATIFRTVHTIKGTAGFLGYSRLESLAHAGESLLVLLREGTLALTPPMTSALLVLVDKVRESLRSIEERGQESADAHVDLLATLHELRVAPAIPAALASAPAIVQAPTAVAEAIRTPVSAPQVVQASAGAPADEAPARAGESVKEEAARPATPGAADSAAPVSQTAAAAPGSSAVSDGNVRVDVGLLDKLMNLVGELVLARNQILQYGAGNEELAFVGASQRLNLITTELQEQVMRTRMQPIGNVWTKLPRVVRDLAISCGKQVRVEMVGKTTELDRTIIEAIKDPLTHIVRNAVDHGVEMPDVRAAAGKPRTGTLTLRAYHEGGQVNIEIQDDGAGLNLERIRAKASERNLVTAERLEHMSVYELMQLVFLPGFSTAAKVTNVSGRGVGMDVVKTNIERIGGSVDLNSRPGQGTTLKIRIPLTLAIVPALVVVSAAERYAIPQTNLLELVRLEGEEARNGVEMVYGAPVFRLRGQLLPLVYLSKALGLGATADEKSPGDSSRTVNIVVLQANEGQIGLVVDEVRDTEEIVVKPLGKELKGIQVFAGATIMGDGRVALILDVVGLAQHVGVASRTRERAASLVGAAKALNVISAKQSQTLLLFKSRENSTMAIPLALVARIEEFPRNRLERAGDSSVVQYRGEVLPLIDLSDRTGAEGEPSDLMPIIVYSEETRSVGFIVEAILDVVDEVVTMERCTSQPGILGSVVVQGKVTDILDVQNIIRSQAPWFYEGAAA